MAGETKLAKAVIDAYARTCRDKIGVATAIADPATTKRLRDVVKPPKVAGSLRKTGVLLILTPDPISLVPGVAMVGASFVMKRREPAGLEDLVSETAKMMRELQSLANNS